MPSPDTTYEDRYSFAGRWMTRGARTAAWYVKTILGKPRRILVEIRWRLGDEIMALPIYEALRMEYPDAALHVWCNYPELLEGSPFVDAVNDPHPRPDHYIFLRSGPREEQRLEHYADLANVPVPPLRPRLFYEDWETSLLDDVKKPFVALATGASWSSKRWPVERWQALGRALLQRGYSVVELGHESESIGIGKSLCGKTKIREAACVLHAARLLVCCDSGLMHLALAAGTPTLALFGPTDPAILVRTEEAFHPVVAETPCQGCWNRNSQPLEPGKCPEGDPFCLKAITMETVIDKVCALLGDRPAIT